LVRRSNFRHQASPRVSSRENTQRRKVELWARNVRKFCLNSDFDVTFWDLLHAVKLRHRTDGFNSPPKEGVLRIFFALIIRRLRPGANPRTEGQHATSRPPKLWARNVPKFCLNSDFRVTFWDLLHAVKLRHGTDGFTSHPKEGVLRIFFALKIRRFRPYQRPARYL